MARPKKYNKKDIDRISALLEEYIDATPIPILKEFAYQNKVSRDALYDYEEFFTLRKRCLDKKEAALERQALDGAINTTMAIFSLKQLGWKDKHETEHTGGITLVFDSALKDV